MRCVALLGENKIPITSAVKFIKLLFQYKQIDAFTELATEMLQVLPVSSTKAPILLFISVRKVCILAFQVWSQVGVLICVSLMTGCRRAAVQEGRAGARFASWFQHVAVYPEEHC